MNKRGTFVFLVIGILILGNVPLVSANPGFIDEHPYLTVIGGTLIGIGVGVAVVLAAPIVATVIAGAAGVTLATGTAVGIGVAATTVGAVAGAAFGAVSSGIVASAGTVTAANSAGGVQKISFAKPPTLPPSGKIPKTAKDAGEPETGEAAAPTTPPVQAAPVESPKTAKISPGWCTFKGGSLATCGCAADWISFGCNPELAKAIVVVDGQIADANAAIDTLRKAAEGLSGEDLAGMNAAIKAAQDYAKELQRIKAGIADGSIPPGEGIKAMADARSKFDADVAAAKEGMSPEAIAKLNAAIGSELGGEGAGGEREAGAPRPSIIDQFCKRVNLPGCPGRESGETPDVFGDLRAKLKAGELPAFLPSTGKIAGWSKGVSRDMACRFFPDICEDVKREAPPKPEKKPEKEPTKSRLEQAGIVDEEGNVKTGIVPCGAVSAIRETECRSGEPLPEGAKGSAAEQADYFAVGYCALGGEGPGRGGSWSDIQNTMLKTYCCTLGPAPC